MTGGLRQAPPASPAQSPAAAAATAAGLLASPTGPRHRSARPLHLPGGPRKRNPGGPGSRDRAGLVIRGPCSRRAQPPELCPLRGRRLTRHREGAGTAGPRGFGRQLCGLGGDSFPLAVGSRARPVSHAQYGQMLLLHGGDTVPAAAGG